jgi:hypothetical protein
MPVLWQISDLSTVDAAGNYQDDLAAGVENTVGFALDTFAPGDTPEVVTIASVAARLYRYRQGYEISGPTIARRISVATSEGVGATLDVDLTGDNVNITIPADTMELDQSYQLVIDATDDVGLVWTRTREYRAVAG